MDPQLQSAFATGYERLAAWADLLDTINVFPVADADTGSNLIVSLAPLHRMDESADAIAKRLLVSALGNSGNIACGFFTAFIAENPSKDLFLAVKAGRNNAWQTLADPKPGTMLTVFDELLDHCANVAADRLAATYPALIEKLEKAVHSTAGTLPELKAAGVVDAGALGIFLFLVCTPNAPMMSAGSLATSAASCSGPSRTWRCRPGVGRVASSRRRCIS